MVHLMISYNQKQMELLNVGKIIKLINMDQIRDFHVVEFDFEDVLQTIVRVGQ
jgi:hypothetical protein